MLYVQCRETILELYQRQKFLKKRQLLDELEAREIVMPEKLVVKSLKVGSSYSFYSTGIRIYILLQELCYGKGGHWRLLGT